MRAAVPHRVPTQHVARLEPAGSAITTRLQHARNNDDELIAETSGLGEHSAWGDARFVQEWKQAAQLRVVPTG